MERLATKPLSFTQVGLFEYLLVAHPDASISEKVLAEKQKFAKTTPLNITSKTQPHITIANFLARDVMEETIIRYTQRICNQQASFEVELNNYSGYPPNTIYLRVQNPQPFKQLAKELKVVADYIGSCSCPPAYLKTHPRVTIAKKIPEHIYRDVLMEYAQKTFHEKFMVNELVLLRRNNEYDTCKVIHVFRLQPPEFKPFANTLFN